MIRPQKTKQIQQKNKTLCVHTAPEIKSEPKRNRRERNEKAGGLIRKTSLFLTFFFFHM